MGHALSEETSAPGLQRGRAAHVGAPPELAHRAEEAYGARAAILLESVAGLSDQGIVRAHRAPPYFKFPRKLVSVSRIRPSRLCSAGHSRAQSSNSISQESPRGRVARGSRDVNVTFRPLQNFTETMKGLFRVRKTELQEIPAPLVLLRTRPLMAVRVCGLQSCG